LLYLVGLTSKVDFRMRNTIFENTRLESSNLVIYVGDNGEICEVEHNEITIENVTFKSDSHRDSSNGIELNFKHQGKATVVIKDLLIYNQYVAQDETFV